MHKIGRILILLLPAFLAAGLVSCSSTGKNNTAGQDVKEVQGWVNEDTYRIIATGSSDTGYRGRSARRKSAKQYAVLDAQRRITEVFMGNEFTLDMNPDYNRARIYIEKELGPIFTNGRIVSENYDNETDDCEIVYEVTGAGLKKKVSTLFGRK